MNTRQDLEQSMEFMKSYHEYKRNENLYDLKNKIVVSKDGKISSSCYSNDLNEQEEILIKAINHTKELKALQEKLLKRTIGL